MKHTPGPWKTLKTFGGVTHVMTQDDKSIALLRGYKHPYSANARLIAAAPDLLDVVKEANAELERLNDPRGFVSIRQMRIMEKARAAIAKATGGEV